MKVIFYHFTLVLTGGSFCSFTVCTWLRFLSEVGGTGSFLVSAKNWSDSLAACEVRHAWEPLDLFFQMFSWSPLPEIFLISSFQIVSWCHPCKYPLSFPLPPFQISFSTSLSQMCAEFIFANFWRTRYLLLLRLLKKSIRQRYPPFRYIWRSCPVFSQFKLSYYDLHPVKSPHAPLTNRLESFCDKKWENSDLLKSTPTEVKVYTLNCWMHNMYHSHSSIFKKFYISNFVTFQRHTLCKETPYKVTSHKLYEQFPFLWIREKTIDIPQLYPDISLLPFNRVFQRNSCNSCQMLLTDFNL